MFQANETNRTNKLINNFVSGPLNDQNKLVNYQLRVGSTLLPHQPAILNYSATSNQLVREYYNTLVASGNFNSEYGSEKMDEWVRRGNFFTMELPRDVSQQSSMLDSYLNFDPDPTQALTELMDIIIISHTTSIISLQYSSMGEAILASVVESGGQN
jgi:hypothetical protein